MFFYSVKTNAKILEVNRSTNKKSVCRCLSKDDMAKQCSSKKKCDVKDCNLRQNSLLHGTSGVFSPFHWKHSTTRDLRNVKYWNLNWNNNLASLFIPLGVDSFRELIFICIVLIYPDFAQNCQKLTDHFKGKVVILKHSIKGVGKIVLTQL